MNETAIPGMKLVQVGAGDVAEVEEVVDPQRAMLVIAVASHLHIDITYDWLATNLYGGAQTQLEEAALIVTTDPAGRMACVLKCETHEGEMLTMHTASIG